MCLIWIIGIETLIWISGIRKYLDLDLGIVDLDLDLWSLRCLSIKMVLIMFWISLMRSRLWFGSSKSGYLFPNLESNIRIGINSDPNSGQNYKNRGKSCFLWLFLFGSMRGIGCRALCATRCLLCIRDLEEDLWCERPSLGSVAESKKRSSFRRFQ